MILRILSYNIRFGGSGRADRLAEAIRLGSPDLVVFQEASEPEVIESIADTLNFPFWAAKPGHSIAFISRIPIARHAWHYSPGSKHSFLELVLPDFQTRIFGLHLSARFSKWSEERRVREIRQLLGAIAEYQAGFHALVGDFNTLAPGELLEARRMPAWIRALIWVSGRDIQRQTIQALLDAHYIDGFRQLYPDVKGYTFPSWDPHLRLDYVFVPTQFADRLCSVQVINAPPQVVDASDHFPILATLELAAAV